MIILNLKKQLKQKQKGPNPAVMICLLIGKEDNVVFCSRNRQKMK